MATVTFIKYDHQAPSALSRVSDYIKQEQKTVLGGGMQLVSGQNCSPQFAAQEFLATRQMYRKDSPVFFYHYVQSFHPEEPVTGEQAHEVAKEFAARAWPESEVLIATHLDAGHIHSHFIVNAVCHDSGKMLRQGPGTLSRLRPISDEICMQHELSVLPKQERKQSRGMTGREYRSAVKGESWKLRLMNTIDGCMRYAASREEFISLMRSEGYAVRWEDSRQNITYTLPSGYKCRDDRLHDTRYLKGAMGHEFEIRQQIMHGRIETAEFATAKFAARAGTAADAGAAGTAPNPGGVERSAEHAGVSVLPDGGAEQSSGENRVPTDHLCDEGAGSNNIRTALPDPDAARTGWEKERAALFAAPSQNQTAAPVPGAAADPDHSAGVVGSVVELGHAVERAENDASPVIDATAMPQHIDGKQLCKLREKKIAAGHKPNDHEDEELTMQMKL